MQEELYSTVSMYEAAAILAAQDFQADYEDILPPAPKEKRSSFVLKIYSDPKTIAEYTKNYYNGRVFVEPRTYDEKIHMLRDILKRSKGN